MTRVKKLLLEFWKWLNAPEDLQPRILRGIKYVSAHGDPVEGFTMGHDWLKYVDPEKINMLDLDFAPHVIAYNAMLAERKALRDHRFHEYLPCEYVEGVLGIARHTEQQLVHLRSLGLEPYPTRHYGRTTQRLTDAWREACLRAREQTN